MRKPSALIIQPGLQHSHQLAWALQDRGLLYSFWSGIPVRTSTDHRPVGFPRQVWERMKTVEVPVQYRLSKPSWWFGMRMATRLGTSVQRFKNMHRVLHSIDRAVACKIARLKPDAVVAYENAALNIFKAAKECGVKCILDAASLHYDCGAKLIDPSAADYQREINRWKQGEIDLADHIVCCSELARESYIRAGVDPAKITALALGASLPDNKIIQDCPPATGPVRFAFAGAMRQLKGIDILFTIFERLHKQRTGEAELHIYGGTDSGEWIAKARALPNVWYHGNLPQSKLFEALAGCHCLVLPSRLDSFGMVAAEALAVGTPVLLSDQTGAKMIIERHQGAGWITAAELEPMEAAIRNLIANPTALITARTFATRAAMDFTWQAYRQRAGTFFQAMLEAPVLQTSK